MPQLNFLITISTAGLKIQHLQYHDYVVKSKFGGKDFLVDKTLGVVFFFEWSLKVWVYDLNDFVEPPGG